MRHHCAGNHQRSKDVKVIGAADRSARRNECRSREKNDRGFGSGGYCSRRFGRCRAEGRESDGGKEMKAKKIAFTGIPVTDIKRARAFYEGVLGLKFRVNLARVLGSNTRLVPTRWPSAASATNGSHPKTAPASLLKSKTSTPPSKASNKRMLILRPKELRVLCAGWLSCKIRTATN